ncbi:myosin regulatory light polypeptide 9 [Microtus ochrogaster]|uniref:Myosin regulatory light polypeptide 9 n=1 Tax=Microtus ochrogaster TaxID=79684 RepID=A0ABM1ASM8_MICOH|nr:myosin regulatory light polypeptide 9 [Microtus ochrogaster]
MSSKRAKAKTTKKRPQRATSNVFAMFDQSQIQEFKEAFNMIDQNRDGFIDKEDLHDMLASLGSIALTAHLAERKTEEVDEMYREAPIDKKGNFNYVEFTRILKHGAKDKDD